MSATCFSQQFPFWEEPYRKKQDAIVIMLNITWFSRWYRKGSASDIDGFWGRYLEKPPMHHCQSATTPISYC